MNGRVKHKGEIQSVARALEILQALGAARRDLSVTELAREMGVHKSTVSRLLSTLEAYRFVEQDRETGRFHLGYRISELSAARFSRRDVRSMVRPFLEKLMERSGEVVHLGILDGGKAVYIDKVEGPHGLTLTSYIGRSVYAHCTALGKVLLAYMDPGRVREIIQRVGLPAFTENTITDEAELFQCLEQVRVRGYAIDDEEHERGVCCVAAPVCDAGGAVIAAISLSAPTVRISKKRLPEMIAMVKEAAEEASRALGFVPIPA
ncbi:MAG: IclR family transcriptional regulator [Clostridia bacterium]|nr:IclR family transcriptional regulator [Clostridia bacterium]